MNVQDPAFWRAGAISSTVVMSIVLVFLTVNSLSAITAGGRNVPPYTVINQAIDYQFDATLNMSMPVIGGEQLLFRRKYSVAEAEAMMDLGKLVIQSRACMDCHILWQRVLLCAGFDEGVAGSRLAANVDADDSGRQQGRSGRNIQLGAGKCPTSRSCVRKPWRPPLI